jgi:hypothetical protein
VDLLAQKWEHRAPVKVWIIQNPLVIGMRLMSTTVPAESRTGIRPQFTIQFIRRNHHSVSQILDGFDNFFCQVAQDAWGRIWMTPAAQFSHYFKVNPVDLRRRGGRYERQLIKYMFRGIDILIPRANVSLPAIGANRVVIRLPYYNITGMVEEDLISGPDGIMVEAGVLLSVLHIQKTDNTSALAPGPAPDDDTLYAVVTEEEEQQPKRTPIFYINQLLQLKRGHETELSGLPTPNPAIELIKYRITPWFRGWNRSVLPLKGKQQLAVFQEIFEASSPEDIDTFFGLVPQDPVPGTISKGLEVDITTITNPDIYKYIAPPVWLSGDGIHAYHPSDMPFSAWFTIAAAPSE